MTQWSAPPEFAQEEGMQCTRPRGLFSRACETEKSPWQQYIAADGKKYYFNAVTQETTWDEPAVGYTPAEPVQNKDDDDDNGAKSLLFFFFWFCLISLNPQRRTTLLFPWIAMPR